MLLGVPNLIVAGHAPLTHGGDDLQIGRQRLDRHVEADLVIALAGTAMGDVAGALLVRVVDQDLGDQRASQRGRERVHVLVQRASLERRNGEVAHERFFGIRDERLDRTGTQRLLPNDLEILLVAHVDGDRDHVEVVLLVDPADRDRGVEAARIRENPGHAATRIAQRRDFPSGNPFH